MKTFKDLKKSLPKKEKKLDTVESIELIFGKHSQENNIKYEPIELQFGKHSQSSKKLTESEIAKIKSLEKHYSKFTSDDIKHIKKYTSNSRSLNTALLKSGSKKLGNSNLENHKKGMDAVVKRHAAPKKLTVYTGVGKNHPLEKHLNSDKHFHVRHNAFTSASTSKNVAEDFVGYKAAKKNLYHTHMLKINVPKGHPGAYVDHHSLHDGEREFILPRGTKLKVHPHPKVTVDNYDHSGFPTHHHVWTADIVK